MSHAMNGVGARARGFTLLELVIALTLLALMASVLYGALGFAGRSWEGGEAKAEATAGMRLSHGFLRTQLEAQHPLRMRKIPEFPLLFTGTREELRFAAPLPARITGGGIWYYRLARQERKRSEPPRARAHDARRRCRGASRVRQDRALDPRRRHQGAARRLFRLRHAAPHARPHRRGANAGTTRNRLPLLIRLDVVPKRGPAVAARCSLRRGRRWNPGAGMGCERRALRGDGMSAAATSLGAVTQ